MTNRERTERTSSGAGACKSFGRNRMYFAVVLLALLSASALAILQAESDTSDAATEIVGGIEYETIDSEHVRVVGLNGHLGTSVIIPSTVDMLGSTYEVTEIGEEAFKASNITYVSIPNSVTSIREYAFAYTSDLTAITIPDSVIRIGDSAFDCSSIETVTFSGSSRLTTIGFGVFWRTTSLTSINIPDSVTSIGEYAFAYTSDLTSINIPDSVTSIGNGAFTDSALTAITIPDSVTRIGNSAFAYIPDLDKITFSEPSNLEDIGSWIFYGSALTAITIPDSVTRIGFGAFADLQSLSTVTISDSSRLGTIEGYAFKNTGLGEINIPNSVTNIGLLALADSPWESIIIPQHAHLGTDILKNCPNPIDVTVVGTGSVSDGILALLVDDWKVAGNSYPGVKSLTIDSPETVDLTGISIPNGKDLIITTRTEVNVPLYNNAGTEIVNGHGKMFIGTNGKWCEYGGTYHYVTLTFAGPAAADIDYSEVFYSTYGARSAGDSVFTISVPDGMDLKISSFDDATYPYKWLWDNGQEESYEQSIEFNGVSADVDDVTVYLIAGYNEITLMSASTGTVSYAYSIADDSFSGIGPETFSAPDGVEITFTLSGVTEKYVKFKSASAIPEFIPTSQIPLVYVPNANITITFVDPVTVTASSDAHSSISPSGSVEVPSGGFPTFEFAPASGCVISDVIVDGHSLGPIGGSYTFENVTSNGHTISVVSSQVAYTVTASSDAHSSISPSGSVAVPYGGSATFTFTAAPGYSVSDVLVDGRSRSDLVSLGSYTFQNIDGGHTISVISSPSSITISASVSGGDGYIEYRVGSSRYARLSGPISLSEGSDVYVRVVPAEGYEFVDWTGTVTGTDAELHIGSRDASVTAYLKQTDSPTEDANNVIWIALVLVLAIIVIGIVWHVFRTRRKG